MIALECLSVLKFHFLVSKERDQWKLNKNY